MRNKTISRLITGALNGLRQFVSLLGNALIAWLVIRSASDELWGSFVSDLILISLSIHLVSWGDKEFLLRAFSQEPASIRTLFYRVLWSRSLLLSIPLVLILVLTNSTFWPYLILWLIAQYFTQAVQVLILYHRKFWQSGILEALVLFGGLGAIYYFPEALNRLFLVQVFAGMAVFRMLLYWILSRPGKLLLDFQWSFFRSAFPFFLIGLSGLLQSKTDLYMVNVLMPDDAVGQYQVIISIFLFYQAVAGMVLEPFARNFYRSKESLFIHLQQSMAFFGLLLIALTFPLVYWVFTSFYGFSLTWDYYIYGYLFVFPVFLYLPWIYLLYKRGMEKQVMYVNFFGAAVNCGATYLFLSSIGLIGALVASACAQITILVIYVKMTNKLASK